jgi:outer membrane scaffolding protein for murein synthesis (MipA/OmpV family)
MISVTTALRTAALAFGVMMPAAAFAELTNTTLVGAGVRSRPAYDGSDSQRTEPVPVLRYLGETWFVRSTQGPLEGGVRWELTTGLHAGAQLAYEPERRASESAFLIQHNVATIGRGASLGLHLEWDAVFGTVPVTLLMRLRRHTDADFGAAADVRLSAGVFKSGPVSAGVFTQATRADTKATRSRYGITPQQSATTGLPVFGAGSGWLSASGGLIWSVDMSRDWAVVGSVEGRRLLGDAAGSPLAERASNHYLSVGIAHRY